ncbi:MAG: CARDB domain-containing protein [Candidatus Poseidoniales archaeon]
MQRLTRSILAVAFFAAIMLSQSTQAEESDDFNALDLYFYGDLDNGDGNISTTRPTSDTDTQSDCPQDSNRLSWPGQDRQWEDVGSWETVMQTPGEVASGDYTFTIWANSTQGTVEDVQFRITIYIGIAAGVTETSQSKTVTDSSEVATRFDINFDISNASFEYGDDFIIDLEYSGGDPGENPLTGGSSTEQIVVLTSSIEHPAGIGNLTINHYMASFPEIVVEDFSERVFVKTQVQSAFGVSDIDSNDWTLGVYGLSSGNQGLTADFSMKSLNNDTHEVSFYWYYNQDLAISDTYHFFIQITDIQQNKWEVESDEDLYLVIHGYEIDNYIGTGDIQINNQTGISKVQAGSSFTIDITVSAQGDPLISYNPIPISVIWVSGTNEIVLYETAVFAEPGESVSVSYRHTFEEKGEYLIKVIIDRGDLVAESNEDNNVAEYLLIVDEPVKEDMLQSIIDNITGGGTTSMLLLVSIASIILAVLFINRNKTVTDFEWEEDDEF